jgi:hypothetical protein
MKVFIEPETKLPAEDSPAELHETITFVCAAGYLAMAGIIGFVLSL